MRSIRVYCHDETIKKHIADILIIFYLVKDTVFVQDAFVAPLSGDFLSAIKTDRLITMTYTYADQTQVHSFVDMEEDKNRTRTIKGEIFDFINGVQRRHLPWGFLTGVRPVKMAVNLLLQGHPKPKVENFFQSAYRLAFEKARLLADLAEKDLLMTGYSPVITDSVSLYISIPFCPNRCAYCSFTSYAYEKYKDMASAYVDALIKELGHIGHYVRERGRFIQTIYIGGGTPGVLATDEIRRLLHAVDGLCTRETNEVTFEAGRPEVFDDEKQKAVREHYVTRICINPQTMDDGILIKSGRQHTVKDFYRCFDNAVKNGYNNINTDVIVGLPGETPDSFERNMNALLNLGQQSVTVHVLAMKKNAAFMQLSEADAVVVNDGIVAMMKTAENELFKREFYPYYLYRQKMSVGNLENIGYSKKGYECLYNIQMIGERQTVLGAGAGATSRFIGEDFSVTRVCHKKPVEWYMDDIANNRFGY